MSFLTDLIKWGVFPGVRAANPSASVGLTAVNGTAATFMRSDAAPALDQTAAYAFTGLGNTTLAANKVLTLPVGSAANPSLAGGTNGVSGVYFSGTSGVGITSNGVVKLDFNITQGSVWTFGGAAVVMPVLSLTSNGGVLEFGGNNALFSNGGGTVLGIAPSTFWTAIDLFATANPVSLSSPGANILTLGRPPSATPAAPTLQAPSSRAGTDSNVGGANLTVAPGTGTGTSTLAALIVNSPIAVASGSGAQTQTRSYAAISGSLVVGPGSALATTATDGFLYLPSCAGSPTGVPTANTGALAHAYDSTNEELEIYSNGQWNGIPVSGGINTAPAGNVTLRANYSLVVIDAYTIAATLTLGAGSRMRMI